MAPVTAASAPAGVLDLRLGATSGSVAVHFDEAADITRRTRTRRGGETVRAEEICVAVVRRTELLHAAATNRMPVRA
jgi:hypothetical protein